MEKEIDYEKELKKEKVIHLELQEVIDDLTFENKKLKIMLNLALDELVKIKNKYGEE